MNEAIYNVKVLNSLKNELLCCVSEIFSISSQQDNTNDLIDAIASNILVAYLLSNRYGIGVELINQAIKQKIDSGIQQNHSYEKYFGDLTALKKILNTQKE